MLCERALKPTLGSLVRKIDCRIVGAVRLVTAAPVYRRPLVTSVPAWTPWQTDVSAPPTLDLAQSKPYYLTTPIFYVNADPHIGHLYTAVLSDILVRWNALRHQGRSPAGPLGPAPDQKGPLFCTGTDEHGLKIQRAAEDLGLSPRSLCDKVSTRFRDLAQAAGVALSTFIRTTEPRHVEAVHQIWRVIKEKGMIYKGEHHGWYSISDEAFYPETQVSDFEDPTTGEVYKVWLILSAGLQQANTDEP